MEWIPELRLRWLNGWILLAVLYGAFGLLLLAFPRDVVRRLYDRSGWTRQQSIRIAVGKLPILVGFVLTVLSPLRIGSGVFLVGMMLFVLGFAGFIMALIHFKNTPPDQPAKGGLYSVSRNPQISTLYLASLGIGLSIGSWLALFLTLLSAVGQHLRVLAEEQTCLAQYGDSYREYMQRVPRYFPNPLLLKGSLKEK